MPGLTMRVSIECDMTMFPFQPVTGPISADIVCLGQHEGAGAGAGAADDENLITYKQSAQIETSSVLQSWAGHRHNGRLKIF